ncbi:MAG: tRNA pseudouridine(13) synthase TruD [Thermoplasmata archaeon]|nr:tRNA pseudouridine(13) synthase TruD [Thermoplasmata archaeon]
MEEDIGIEAYLTKGEGIKGKIKEEAEDFIVEELPLYPKPAKGKFVVAMVKSKNWEMNRLIERIAKNLRISYKAVGYAGIKDKRAITTQIMSFAAPIEKVLNLRIPDVEVSILYKTNKPVTHGKLLANKFEIVIKNIEDGDKFKKILEELASIKGYPNFFGVQRFGITRPITHIVGKYIIKNDLEKAVMSYAANPIEGEDKECYEAREFLEKTKDFKKALEVYPKKLSFERRMVEYLAEHPDDWENALLQLPSNLIRIFIHAYQSYLFNKMLSLRIKKGIPINEAIEGDVILKSMQNFDGIYANEKNIEKINKEIKKGKCFPSAAIVGYDSKLAKGEMGEIEAKVLENEGISIDEFKMPYMPWLSSAGLRRSVFAPIKNILYRLDGNNLHLKFILEKGCYATSLLREFMKADIYSY